MKLLREITEDYHDEVIPIMEAISKSVKELKLTKKGGVVTNKMVKDYIKANPSLTAASAAFAMASYKQYKTNKRNTVKFFAKTPFEKKLISNVVKSMLASKQFKMHRTRYSSGGKYWELQLVKQGF